MSYVGAEQSRALLGAWHEIVGWQESGRPSHLHHGPYGGRGYHRHHHGPLHGHPYGHYTYLPSPGYAPGYPGIGYSGEVYPVAPVPGYGEEVYPTFQAEGYPMHAYVSPGYAYGGSTTPSLVERPGPSRTDRITLPMSSGVHILPNTSAQITSRPQSVAFRPERMIIGGNPSEWVVNDVKVGNRSQFAQSGDVPGEMYAATTIDGHLSMETVQTSMDFVIVVTFVGDAENGAPFVCGVLGTAAV